MSSHHPMFAFFTENYRAAVQMLILSPLVWGTIECLTGHSASSVHSETAFSRKEFSFTDSILHAGRLVTESLEKGQAHVLLHPVPKFQYAEDILLRCKGKKNLPHPCFLLTACCIFSQNGIVLSC